MIIWLRPGENDRLPLAFLLKPSYSLPGRQERDGSVLSACLFVEPIKLSATTLHMWDCLLSYNCHTHEWISMNKLVAMSAGAALSYTKLLFPFCGFLFCMCLILLIHHVCILSLLMFNKFFLSFVILFSFVTFFFFLLSFLTVLWIALPSPLVLLSALFLSSCSVCFRFSSHPPCWLLPFLW